MNARYYNPDDGRFISQDSFRGEVNDPGQWHLYVYCANNPINYVDPSGHKVLSYTNKNNKITIKSVIPWNSVQKIIAGCCAVNSFVGPAIVKIGIAAVRKLASSYFLAFSIIAGLTSLIIGRYLKNHSMIMTLSFNYKVHYRNVRVHRKIGRKNVITKWYSISNKKWSVNLRA